MAVNAKTLPNAVKNQSLFSNHYTTSLIIL